MMFGPFSFPIWIEDDSTIDVSPFLRAFAHQCAEADIVGLRMERDYAVAALMKISQCKTIDEVRELSLSAIEYCTSREEHNPLAKLTDQMRREKYMPSNVPAGVDQNLDAIREMIRIYH